MEDDDILDDIQDDIQQDSDDDGEDIIDNMEKDYVAQPMLDRYDDIDIDN